MRSNFGTKRFKLSDIGSKFNLLVGSNDSGKTMSLRTLRQILTEREQKFTYIDAYNYIPDRADYFNRETKVTTVKSITKDACTEGYVLIDNLDRVINYENLVYFFNMLEEFSKEHEYFYCIVAGHTFDIVMVLNKYECTMWNNETGRPIKALKTISDYKQLWYLRIKEIEG